MQYMNSLEGQQASEGLMVIGSTIGNVEPPVVLPPTDENAQEQD